jgi:hypothetical protein
MSTLAPVFPVLMPLTVCAVCVLCGQDAIQHLDHGDLGSECVEEVGELHADRTGADDDHRLGKLGDRQGVVAREDGGAVTGCEGQLVGSRAGRDHDVVGGQLAGRLATGSLVVVVIGFRDLDRAGGTRGSSADDLRMTVVVVDLVLLEQEPDAAVQAAGDRAAAADHLLKVDLDRVGVDHDAPLLAVGDRLLVELRVVQQCLGRDAAPVEADASEVVPFDDGGLETELRGANRANVSAGSAADHDEVVVLALGHRSNPSPSCKCRPGEVVRPGQGGGTILVEGADSGTMTPSQSSLRGPLPPLGPVLPPGLSSSRPRNSYWWA